MCACSFLACLPAVACMLSHHPKTDAAPSGPACIPDCPAPLPLASRRTRPSSPSPERWETCSLARGRRAAVRLCCHRGLEHAPAVPSGAVHANGRWGIHGTVFIMLLDVQQLMAGPLRPCTALPQAMPTGHANYPPTGAVQCRVQVELGRRLHQLCVSSACVH